MTLPAAARLQSRKGADLVFEGVRIDGCVDGLLFEVALEQRFRNPGARHIEVIYTFPLPDGAVLLGVDVRLGDAQLRGTVVEKRQAARDYEDSLAAGDAAIMLEKNRDHSYSLNLGNLAAGEACVVTVRYAQTLQFEQRGLRLCIPMVIAPRYGDPVRDGGLAPHQALVHDVSAQYPLTLALTLAGALAHARVGSPSHAVTTERTGDAVTVSLARSGALDRDFILVLDRLAHDSVAVTAADDVTPGQRAALASFCPRTAAAPRALAAQLLVDCSGSMAGDSIDAAKRALHAIVANMQEGDRFSLSRFGGQVAHRGRGLWRAGARTRLAASRWVDALQADMGGTEMEEALTSTFAAAGGPGDVLLITDGQIEAIDSAIAAAQASGHRIFIVGIGSSPAGSHLRRLAQASGGACDFCAPGERVEPAVLRMFARLRSPRLHALRSEWPAAQCPAWTSPLPDAVFDGDTVNLFALGCAAMEGEVVLFGREDGGPEQEIARASIGAAGTGGDTLARLAAHARSAAPGEDALQLAIDYQLVTPQTNFLLLHERADQDKAADMPALHSIRPMVPAGWAGTGSVSVAVDGPRIPAMWRRGAPMAADAIREPAVRWDLPAFLRKAADPEPREWIATDGYSGLSPAGLRKRLRTTTPAPADYTYAALRSWGLGVAVLDWLELVIGDGADETQVVAAFVFVIAGGAGAGIDRTLAGRIAAPLAGMDDESWPACVFALDEAATPV